MPKTAKAIFLIIAFHIFSLSARAEIADTEQKFHDLFVTAGYSTAFGAALGAAALGLSENPADKLSYIATGASLGFIGGSIFGTYLAFSPLFANSQRKGYGLLAATDRKSRFKMTVGPIVSEENLEPGAFGKLSFVF